MDGKPVGFGEIGSHEIDAAFENVGHERHAARQAVELRDDERGAMEAAKQERLCQLRSISIATAFDFHFFRDQCVGPLSQEIVNCFPLSVQAEAASPLPVC